MFSSLINKITNKACYAGLDISSSSVKLLVISHNNSYQIEAFDSEPLAENAMIEKDIKEAELVGEAIKKLVQRCPVKISSVAVAIADSSIFTKIIPMEKALSEKEIEEQILFEAERHIPYPIEEVRFDFNIIGESTETNYVDVLIAASRSETVDNYINAVVHAGLKLNVVDVESYALLRACQMIEDQIPNKKPEHLKAIFDMGESRSVLTAVKGTRPIYTRGDTFNGHQLTEYLTQTMNISKVEAEAIVKGGNWTEKVSPEIVQNYVNKFVEHIRRGMQLFYTATQYDGVDFIILAGGKAQLPGLVEQVSNILNTPTIVANPFLQMSFAKQVNSEILLRRAPAFMQTCGLALRSFDSLRKNQ